jgi:hypothetical protein
MTGKDRAGFSLPRLFLCAHNQPRQDEESEQRLRHHQERCGASQQAPGIGQPILT